MFYLQVPSITPRQNKICDRAVSVVGPTLWNSLPLDVKSQQTLHVFKNGLKTYLLCKAFGRL